MNKAFKRKGNLSFKNAYYWYWLDNQILKAKQSNESFKIRTILQIADAL